MIDYQDCICGHEIKEHKNNKVCAKCDCNKMKIFVSEKETQRLIGIRTEYYKTPSIRHLIISQLKSGQNREYEREFTILTKRFYPKVKIARLLQCYKYSQYDFYFENMGLFNAPFTNFYFSLAHLDNLPLTTMNFAKRTEEQAYSDYQESWMEHIRGYDLLFDIDNLDFSKAYSDSKEIRKLLTNFRIPYQCKFSSSKGFHFLIPFEYMADKITDFGAFVGDCSRLLKEIQGQYEIESLDTSITDAKRVCKLAYTLDKDRIALPLNDEEFDDFDVSKSTFQYVFKERHVILANRGSQLNTHGLNHETARKNFKKFMEYHL